MKKTKKFYKKMTAYALVFCLMLINCGCGKKETSDARNLTSGISRQTVNGKEPDEDFIYATADFSINLFKASAMADLKEGKNVLISPESLVSALSMTANGAKGDNLRQMEQVIANGMDIAEYNRYMYTYNSRLAESKDIKFNIANSIWIKDKQDEIQVKDGFLQICSSYYNSEAYKASFDDSTVSDINLWVDEKTNHMIPTILTEIPEGVVMYLINALAFEGAWEVPYEDEQVNENGKFTNYQGLLQDVNMLESTESYYVCDEAAEGFIKNYLGGEFAFMAILPKDENGLSEYISNMSGETFVNLYNNKSNEDVIVNLPEFSYEYGTELSEALKSMGMEDAFSEIADFSGMASTGTGTLYINRVLHKTFIQVDREGTKAAAVTAVEMCCESVAIEEKPPKQVILDRPFIYAIIDTQTGLPVFMGAVNSIE